MARRTGVLLLAAAALAAGCAGHAKRTDADIVQLSLWLPGFYDDQVQVAQDRQAGRIPHDSVTLAVVPIDAQQIGDHVFYMKEMGGTPRHVMMQRLLSFGAGKDGIVESMWSLTDPARWLDGVATPELFTALQPGDVRPMLGCDLKWKKEGERFTASNDPSRCRVLSPRTGGVESVDLRVELTADELSLSTRSIGPGETSASTGDKDAYIRFRRNGGP